MSNKLEVWVDCDLCPMQRLGTLAHDRGQVRFHYDKTWLAQQDIAFAIDPQLSLDAGPFFPKPEAGNFGIFLDSSPDRWGQTLMRRREALQAKDELRVARTRTTTTAMSVPGKAWPGGLRVRPGSICRRQGPSSSAAAATTRSASGGSIAWMVGGVSMPRQ